MQHAQPILLSHFLFGACRSLRAGHHAIAITAATKRGTRLRWVRGPLAEIRCAIDRNAIARELGFSRINGKQLRCVGDRDFALDYLFALTHATHLSRLAEDFVIFASQEFSYVIFPTNIPPAAA